MGLLAPPLPAAPRHAGLGDQLQIQQLLRAADGAGKASPGGTAGGSPAAVHENTFPADQFVPEDGEEAQQEGAAQHRQQRSKTGHEADEGEREGRLLDLHFCALQQELQTELKPVRSSED